MAGKGTPHKAKASHTGRKYGRNYPGHSRVGHPLSSYVVRMKNRGTFRERKGIRKSN